MNLLHILLLILKLATRTIKTEPHLKFSIFPIGEGDATIIECHDGDSNDSGEKDTEGDNNSQITLIDAGSDSNYTDVIETNYMNYLRKKLQNGTLRNIFITSSESSQSKFIPKIIESLLTEKQLEKINFYIAGSREDYRELMGEYFDKHKDHVFEFTREVEEWKKVSSCGHYPFNDATQEFYKCALRDTKGPIKDSTPIIDICKHFQISVLSANYGGSQTKIYKNNLVIKITPSDKDTPSVLWNGNFGTKKVEDENANRERNFNYIKSAHVYYTSSTNNLKTLSKGLTSSLVLIGQHGAETYTNLDPIFFSDYVIPDYAIVSSDISHKNGNPSCKVLKNLHQSPTFISIPRSKWYKMYQCHMERTSDRDDVIKIDGHDHLFQTTRWNPKHFPYGKLQFYMLSFDMNERNVTTPMEKIQFEIDVKDDDS